MKEVQKQLKVGVVGTGSMGKNHVRVACSNPLIDCIGVFDPNATAGRGVSTAYDIQYFSELSKMLEVVDAIIIASPTTTHFDVAKQALNQGKHCLIEKPITVTVAEAEELIAIAEENSLTIVVGHVERYNPVFPELMKILENEEILSVKANRLSYNVSRANDVDVILDLMIHDLDTLNIMLGGNLEVVSAVGGQFHSVKNDYVAALLKAPNGTIVDVTASKVSQTKLRQLVISCSDSFVTVDYLRKEIEINRHAVSNYVNDELNLQYKHESLVERVFVPNLEPLKAEHTDFAEAILENKAPLVSGYEGLEVLKLALAIQDKCQ